MNRETVIKLIALIAFGHILGTFLLVMGEPTIKAIDTPVDIMRWFFMLGALGVMSVFYVTLIEKLRMSLATFCRKDEVRE